MGSVVRDRVARAKAKRATAARPKTGARPKTEQELRKELRKSLERYRGAFERLGKY